MLLLDARNSRHETIVPVPILGCKVRGITTIAMDLTGEVYGGFSLTSTLKYHFGSSALQVLSWTSCLSLVPAMLSTSEGWQKVQLCGKVSDLKGQALGGLQFLRGVIRTAVSSLCLIPASGINVALFFTASKTASAVADILRSAGGGFLGGASLLSSFSALFFIANGLSFRQKLAAFSTDQERLEMLQGESSNELLYALGKEGVELVQNASLESANEVMKIVYQENTRQILISVLYFTLNLSSAGLTAASFLLTGPSMLFGISVMETALGLIWLVTDSVAFIDSIKTDKPGACDEDWVTFTFLFCSAILITSASLSNGPVPLAISITMGLLLLAVHLSYFAEPEPQPPHISSLRRGSV
ncbi:MAG TPA: hypothetical protein VLG76_03555 [Rhabdochlamydiaceae bacterium]|nr:hypothetical protein [Rhabdochlamydiaceae bacterium]